MTGAELFTIVTSIGYAASILDAVIPPNDIPVLKQIKTAVSLIALNVGHSQNIAPTQAVQESK